MVVEDYGTPHHGNSPEHVQENSNHQITGQIQQPRMPLFGERETVSNDYVEVVPHATEGSLQEAPIRSTLDSK